MNKRQHVLPISNVKAVVGPHVSPRVLVTHSAVLDIQSSPTVDRAKLVATIPFSEERSENMNRIPNLVPESEESISMLNVSHIHDRKDELQIVEHNNSSEQRFDEQLVGNHGDELLRIHSPASASTANEGRRRAPSTNPEGQALASGGPVVTEGVFPDNTALDSNRLLEERQGQAETQPRIHEQPPKDIMGFDQSVRNTDRSAGEYAERTKYPVTIRRLSNAQESGQTDPTQSIQSSSKARGSKQRSYSLDMVDIMEHETFSHGSFMNHGVNWPACKQPAVLPNASVPAESDLRRSSYATSKTVSAEKVAKAERSARFTSFASASVVGQMLGQTIMNQLETYYQEKLVRPAVEANNFEINKLNQRNSILEADIAGLHNNCKVLSLQLKRVRLREESFVNNANHGTMMIKSLKTAFRKFDDDFSRLKQIQHVDGKFSAICMYSDAEEVCTNNDMLVRESRLELKRLMAEIEQCK